ncbi:adenylate/guanylate cyclase domain-containing protein [Pseudorhodoplanes sp.]|uniref:CHASE2 domain-containing protein n=1 Tax=Pseudorhodoplanes sp. TaxID=1934341 RepID=UPI002B5E7851|nr:adenylate/guanylate cyclase domain-containing protein [Pseudorhodoplanes sp.]HWV40105.1 adenylate/guanylate cyclase domain-containing protein [Pseudorhodoplanes sp.]
MAPNLKEQISKLNERRLAIREKRREEREQQEAMGRRFSLISWFGVERTTGFLLLAGFIALRIWDPAPLENLRLRNFDFYQVLKPREPTIKPVVIVDIDEPSLQALGQWPWPRTLLAELVAKLQQAGAAAIAFDVILAEPDRMSPAVLADTLPQVDDATRERMKSLPGNDDVLAQVMRKGGRVVLGQSAILTPTPPAPDLPRTGIATIGPDPSRYLLTYAGLLRNLPVLEKAAAGRGALTLRPERDGIVRRVPLVVKAGNEIVPAMTLDMLRMVTNSGAILIRTDPVGIRAVAVPGLELPTDENGQFWISFSPHDPARFVSAKDVLDGKVGADRFQSRLAVIGTSAVGLLDIKATPVETSMPGVEIHAQVLENVLGQTLLSRPNYAVGTELVVTGMVGVAIVALAPTMGVVTLLGFGFAVALLLAAIAWYLYAQLGLLFDLSFPLIAIFVTYMTLVFINYFREQADRRRIRSAFSHYLSPTLVEQLANAPERLVLGGETRNMTILFSDVRGFTSISETFKEDPQGLTKLMNRLLTPLTNSIIDRKGTIDKYIGDAIMAFWNAPLNDPAHEHNACAAALDMLRKIDELNHEREAEALEDGVPFLPMRIGLGINTGTCVVGNMGSDLRFDYSVLGDPVNLASRLEGRTKEYGVPIILGARTAEKINGSFAALQIDLITVKGKTEPESIYALVGDASVAASQAFKAIVALTQEMFACYRSRDWRGAEVALQRAKQAEETFGLAGVFELYQSRIETFRIAPPPPSWDGVFAFDTK